MGDGLGRAVRVRGAEPVASPMRYRRRDRGSRWKYLLLAAMKRIAAAPWRRQRRGRRRSRHHGGERGEAETGGVIGGDGPKPMVAARYQPAIRTATPSRGCSGESGAAIWNAERFEKISTHTSDVTDVVTNVVGNCGRVAGHHLPECQFNLTDGERPASLWCRCHRGGGRDGGSTETEAER